MIGREGGCRSVVSLPVIQAETRETTVPDFASSYRISMQSP
jgi:hypothetical protein